MGTYRAGYDMLNVAVTVAFDDVFDFGVHARKTPSVPTPAPPTEPASTTEPAPPTSEPTSTTEPVQPTEPAPAPPTEPPPPTEPAPTLLRL
jgi:hypothetical protein